MRSDLGIPGLVDTPRLYTFLYFWYYFAPSFSFNFKFQLLSFDVSTITLFELIHHFSTENFFRLCSH